MPCYTPPPTEEETRAHYYEEFTHNSPLAQMMCDLCQILDRDTIHRVGGLEAWWGAHQRRDRARREREKADAERRNKMRAARAKLTAEERELLGVK